MLSFQNRASMQPLEGSAIQHAAAIRKTRSRTSPLSGAETPVALRGPSRCMPCTNPTGIMGGTTAGVSAGVREGMEAFALGFKAQSVALKCTSVL